MRVSRAVGSVCTFAVAIWLAGCGGGAFTGTGGNGGSGGTGGGTGGTPPTGGSITSINHIVFMEQENRSLDQYFGAMREYWAQNGYPDESFDGLPQFNPTSGAAPLQGPPASNPGCNPNDPPPSDCIFDPSHPVTSYHLKTMCMENPSPSWNESHVDWDYNDETGNSPAVNNGFVWTAAHDARSLGYYDTDGLRVMGYYDGNDLNYYYFMASNFATSDRFFNPAMSRTNINREYLLGATSHGYAYPNGTTAADTPQIPTPPIFEELQNAGISWKIYVNPTGTGCPGPPYTAACLVQFSYLDNFTWAQTAVSTYPQNIVPISQYFTDLQNGTLPQVAYIAPASNAGLDEHGTDTDNQSTAINIQAGAKYVSTLINGLMQSSSWSSSVFFLTFDEFGGQYDHVPPQPEPSPDGIKPVDLQPGDICTKSSGPSCDFVFTGYRVPLLVVSPYANKHYVSHTVEDTTAILKFIETRFNLPPLTKRDAAQPDMTEYFNFSNPPWMTPPTPPAQNTSGPCYLDHLP